MFFRALPFMILCTACMSHEEYSLKKRVKRDLEERVQLGYNRRPTGSIITPEHIDYVLVESTSSAHDLYEIGSVTKFFTAHLCLLMQEEGALQLDAKIRNTLRSRLPKSSRKIGELTLYQLLSHTSGIIDPEEEDYYNEANGNTTPIADYSQGRLDTYLSQTHLESKSTIPKYSNLGYALVGWVLEEISGKSYSQLLQSYIFDPIGMRDSFVGMPSGKDSHHQTIGSSQGVTVPYWDVELFPAFGGIVSSIHDLSRYFQHCISKPFLDSTVSRQLMVTPFTLPNLPVMTGIGWSKDCRHAHCIYGLAGRTLGFHTVIGFDKEHQIATILLSDSDASGNLGYRWLNPNYPQDDLFESVELPSTMRSEIEGLYRVEEIEIECKVVSNAVYLIVADSKPIILYPSKEGFFFSKHLEGNGSSLYLFDDDLYEVKDGQKQLLARKIK